MTTHHLHGNNEPCPACSLRREVMDAAPIVRDAVPCNVCGGVGFLPLSDAVIVQRTCDEARRLFWPEREKAWAAHNARLLDR